MLHGKEYADTYTLHHIDSLFCLLAVFKIVLVWIARIDNYIYPTLA
jgi:hypothetical protein